MRCCCLVACGPHWSGSGNTEYEELQVMIFQMCSSSSKSNSCWYYMLKWTMMSSWGCGCSCPRRRRSHFMNYERLRVKRRRSLKRDEMDLDFLMIQTCGFVWWLLWCFRVWPQRERERWPVRVRLSVWCHLALQVIVLQFYRIQLYSSIINYIEL